MENEPMDQDTPVEENKDVTMSQEEKLALERAEEQKLRAKYGNIPRQAHSGAGGGGHSLFLQKRLAKGQKYFDSGDYQMAKQKSRTGVPLVPGRGAMPVPVMEGSPTGEAIPTPETVPARKSSIIQPIHDASRSMHLPSDPAHIGGPTSPGPGNPLPNPAVTRLSS